MRSEERLIRSFKGLQDIETNAREVYEDLLEKLTDRDLRNFTTRLIEVEKRHKVLVEEALDLISKD